MPIPPSRQYPAYSYGAYARRSVDYLCSIPRPKMCSMIDVVGFALGAAQQILAAVLTEALNDQRAKKREIEREARERAGTQPGLSKADMDALTSRIMSELRNLVDQHRPGVAEERSSGHTADTGRYRRNVRCHERAAAGATRAAQPARPDTLGAGTDRVGRARYLIRAVFAYAESDAKPRVDATPGDNPRRSGNHRGTRLRRRAGELLAATNRKDASQCPGRAATSPRR